jgi:hypothetical protein
MKIPLPQLSSSLALGSICLSLGLVSTAAGDNRAAAVSLVDQVRHADHEGNQQGMKTGYDELAQFVADKEIGSSVRYWRGFAMWRRAINGFNDKVDRKELEQDLHDALKEFEMVPAGDPVYIEARIAMVSCYGYLLFIHSGEPDRVKEIFTDVGPIMTEVKEKAADNPRRLWVLGPILFTTPPERGGGQDKAIATYQKGLEIIRKAKPATDPLEPVWGEPELLMNMAWSYLNQAKPDVDSAERNARAALALVPYWHYVRDILIPQISAAKSPPK